MHVADGLPVSDVATPTLGVLCFGVSVDLLTTRQDVRVTPSVTLRWGEELNRAVQVIVVIPIDKPAHPAARTVQVAKHTLGIFGGFQGSCRLKVKITPPYLC